MSQVNHFSEGSVAASFKVGIDPSRHIPTRPPLAGHAACPSLPSPGAASWPWRLTDAGPLPACPACLSVSAAHELGHTAGASLPSIQPAIIHGRGTQARRVEERLTVGGSAVVALVDGQVETACNYSTDSLLWDLLSSGINIQVVPTSHHLPPPCLA